MAAETASTDQVVDAAAAGDEAAFARIVAAHHEDLVRVSFVIGGGDASLAQEAAQTAWAIVWRKLHTLRDADRLRPWLVSVAANEARRLARRRGRRALVEIAVYPDLEGMPADAGDPAARVEQVDLANALRRLSPEDRALVALRYVAGLHSGEIAAAMGMSAVGVRTRLARALTRLRKELDDG